MKLILIRMVRVGVVLGEKGNHYVLHRMELPTIFFLAFDF